jgi:hypothetical protein
MFCTCASADLTVTYVNLPFTTGIIAYKKKEMEQMEIMQRKLNLDNSKAYQTK